MAMFVSPKEPITVNFLTSQQRILNFMKEILNLSPIGGSTGYYHVMHYEHLANRTYYNPRGKNM